MVVASDVQTAREAARLIEIEYRVLTPISDPEQALASEDAVWGLDGNLLSLSVYKRGDVEEALSRSAHTIHETFKTQRVEHAFLEPESDDCGSLPQRRPPCLFGRPGSVGRPRPDRLGAGDGPLSDHRGTGLQRRRIRRERRHGQPGPDGSCLPSFGQVGEVHPHPGGVPPHPSQAPPDPDRAVGGLRRGRKAHRSEGENAW